MLRWHNLAGSILMSKDFYGTSRDTREAFTKPSIQAQASACGVTKLHRSPHSNKQARIAKETI